jgi:two-component system OmpR family sensor kinase
VTVDAGRDGAVVRIRVTDQGPGIEPDDVSHVFERFYRADTARATDPATGRPTGLGLGLTIARELLAASGGRIGIERTGPGGTTFVLEIPADGPESSGQRKTIPRT